MIKMREIITKAVLGKIEIDNSEKYILESPEKITTILGCWIINHTYSTSIKDDKVDLKGSFDINIWYSYENDTKIEIFTKRIEYEENKNIELKEKIEVDKLELVTHYLKQPSVTNVKILDDGRIQLYIAKDIFIEFVGNIKLKVKEIDD